MPADPPPVEVTYVITCEACLTDSVAFRRLREAIDEAALWQKESPDGRRLCDKCRTPKPTAKRPGNS